MSLMKSSHSLPSISFPKIGEVKPGVDLEHPYFGLGSVQEVVQWECGEVAIGIDFGTHGVKWLVPQYARLSRPKAERSRTSLFKRLFGKRG